MITRLSRLPLLGLTLLAAPLAPAAVTVDILIVYTPAARAYAGGTSAMLAAVNSYVAATNTAYTNSNVDVVLRLAGSAEVNYTEAASLGTDLGRIQNPGDGYMDEVASLRDTYGADLVALIRRSDAGGVAGIAYVGNGVGGASFAPLAFSVTADNWALGNWAFPHELGHNFGAWHDRQNTNGTPHASAYGWRFYGNNGTQYITLMAYYPGARILHFSNPSILFQGQPTGVAAPAANAADNALLHDTSAPGTSLYRTANNFTGSGVRGDFNGDLNADLVMFNPNTGGRQVWFVANGAITHTATIPGASTDWTMTAVGDFNGDDYSDIVFQNLQTGERSIGLYKGAARIGTLALAAGSSVWRIATSTDFNADGKPDFLFQNISTGERVIGLMDGGTRIGTVTLPAGTPAWLAVGAGDFNADGKSDVVYQNTNTGERSIALYDGTTRIGTAPMATGSALWPIMGSGDFNGDGKMDLVYQNMNTGDIVLGYFDGNGTRTGTANISGAGVWRVSNH